jgi:hypothetical protein
MDYVALTQGQEFSCFYSGQIWLRNAEEAGIALCGEQYR